MKNKNAIQLDEQEKKRANALIIGVILLIISALVYKLLYLPDWVSGGIMFIALMTMMFGPVFSWFPYWPIRK